MPVKQKLKKPSSVNLPLENHMKYLNIRISFLTLAVLSQSFLFGQDDRFLPEGKAFSIVDHAHYYLGYSEEHEQAVWVAYELSENELFGGYDRTDNFRADPKVITGSASLTDYKASGYDRGHLAPAADMAFSQTAMSESFFLSNMSPQVPGFNRGIWKSLESQVRDWAAMKGGLYVITGAIIENRDLAIGPNKVTVPSKYYKVLYSEREGQMIGFVLPNAKSEKGLMEYAIVVDRVEDITGLDFFTELPKKTENFLESVFLFSDWPVDTPSNSTSSSSASYKKSSTSQQCKGIAKSTGNRCRKMTLNEIGYCHYHVDQAGKSTYKRNTKPTYSTGTQCTATTKAGSRCKRKSEAGSSTCWQH